MKMDTLKPEKLRKLLPVINFVTVLLFHSMLLHDCICKIKKGGYKGLVR